MTTLSIDLNDPSVQRLIRHDRHSMSVAHPDSGRTLVHQRTLVQEAGDRGIAQDLSLASGKVETLVRYRDQLLTVDVYCIPGEPIQVHLFCPRCCKQLRVSADRKRIDWDPGADHPHQQAAAELDAHGFGPAPKVGVLSIEPFGCTWEVGGDRHNQGGLHTGVTLCRLKLGISRNVAQGA